jgi:hypothetical protein
VRKLTLDQAAKELGIKRGSVYKRTQRHTLPYTIEPDGQMYVYLDGKIETPKKGPDQRSLHRFVVDVVLPVSSIAAGVLAGFAALLYGLGLLVLWIPIRNGYTGDLTSAWYAASLVPKTVVIGLGAVQLLGWPAIVCLLWISELLLFVLPFYIYWRLKQRKAHRMRTAQSEFRKERRVAIVRWTLWGGLPLLMVVEWIMLGSALTEALSLLAFVMFTLVIAGVAVSLLTRSTTLRISDTLMRMMPRWSKVHANFRDFVLERVMNLGENRIGMRILRLARSPAVPRFPHS